VGTHRGVGIEVHDPARRGRFAYRLDVLDGVHAGELARLGGRRLVAIEQPADARGDEMIFDGGEPGRALRMVCAHVVLGAVDVGNQRNCHKIISVL
jgi:hypothetical protein